MIVLDEIATKIQNILNGEDTEVGATGTKVQATNPTAFYFQVETEGYHIDTIANKKEGVNFIPVFISTMGGQNNPVPKLKQATWSIPITFYYPVRFKNEFYNLYDFLCDAFVGTCLSYGTISGVAVSNIGVPQFSELQALDMEQFKDWVQEKYRQEIDTNQFFMSMTVSLFLTTVGSTYAFANDVGVSLSYKYANKTYTDSSVVFDSGNLQSNSQAQSEQVLGESEASGLPFGVSYSYASKIYYQNNAFYNNLLALWFAGTLQDLEITLTLTIGTNTFTRVCFIQSVVFPINKGDVLSFTITFLKKIEEEQQEGE